MHFTSYCRISVKYQKLSDLLAVCKSSMECSPVFKKKNFRQEERLCFSISEKSKGVMPIFSANSCAFLQPKIT